MYELDWNRERYRTRDRLLEYAFNIVPAYPHSAGLPYVYPWEQDLLDQVKNQLYLVAKDSGYTGTESDFKTQFGKYLVDKPIIFSTYSNFPEVGEINYLYFDTEEKILYYWGDDDYYPVQATLIEGSILDSGGAPLE